jgi:hypothetical protein
MTKEEVPLPNVFDFNESFSKACEREAEVASATGLDFRSRARLASEGDDAPVTPESLNELINHMQMQFMLFGALGLMKHLAAQEGKDFTFPDGLTEEDKKSIDSFVDSFAATISR